MKSQSGLAHLVLILLILFFLIIGVSALFLKNNLFKTSQKAFQKLKRPGSQTSIQMKEEYKNPFEEKTQYSNPFEENKNPFDYLNE
jgi:ABC-type multidrug transport system permease subunit